jgi:hypothetical protein
MNTSLERWCRDFSPIGGPEDFGSDGEPFDLPDSQFTSAPSARISATRSAGLCKGFESAAGITWAFGHYLGAKHTFSASD